MKSFTLGLNFYAGHDTSIFAIFDDDIYALSQERTTRIKHDGIFPLDAVKEMIRYKKINTKEITNIDVGVATLAFENILVDEFTYEMSKLLRDMLISDKELYIKEFEEKKRELNSSKQKLLKKFLLTSKGRSYIKMKLLGKKTPVKKLIKIHLQKLFPNAKLNISFYEHHLCHANASYYTSGFKDALVFTFDGEGDGIFSKLFFVKNGIFVELANSKNIYVENAKEFYFADNGYLSIGNIYSIFTYLLGFTPLSDEGKVEALAAYGKYDNFLYHLLKESYIIKDLSIILKKDVLEEVFSKEFLKEVFSNLKKEDISAAVQRFSEDVVLEYLQIVKNRYADQNLAIAGGVTANVIINNKIYEKVFDSIHITPAMGDEGTAQGAAILKHSVNKTKKPFPQMPYFGSKYDKNEIEKELKESDLRYEYLGDKAYKKAGLEITKGKIGAIFQGRAEFGPRALGNRSIVADARDKDIQKKINSSIKKRPLFQPFCPSILIEEKDRLFQKAYDNKHMTIAFKLKKEYKDTLPGSVHIDLTARVQFVSKKDNKNYYTLIKEVKKETGYGVVINTSFNKHGRTMVLNPKQAIIDFLDTNLDFMVMEGFWVKK